MNPNAGDTNRGGESPAVRSFWRWRSDHLGTLRIGKELAMYSQLQLGLAHWTVSSAPSEPSVN
jgi:hypothetical protein